MIEINVFIDDLKVTWIRKMLKEDKCRWINAEGRCARS